jgi:hypothetical protein
VEAPQGVELTGTNRPRTYHKHFKKSSCSRPLCGSGTTNHPPRERTPGTGCTFVFHEVTAATAKGKRPVPSRTRKLSPSAPMVLHPPGCGRVGHRRTLFRKGPENPDHTTGPDLRAFLRLKRSRPLGPAMCVGGHGSGSGGHTSAYRSSGRSIGPPGSRPPSGRESVLVTAMVVTIVSSACSVAGDRHSTVADSDAIVSSLRLRPDSARRPPRCARVERPRVTVGEWSGSDVVGQEARGVAARSAEIG